MAGRFSGHAWVCIDEFELDGPATRDGVHLLAKLAEPACRLARPPRNTAAGKDRRAGRFASNRLTSCR